MNAIGDPEERGRTPSAPSHSPTEAHSPSVRNIALTDNQIDSRALFAGIREITIAHGGEIYRLRLTAQNKLILTK